MASDEEVFNTGVVRNVETVNFDFGLIFIRGRLLPQKPCRGKPAAVNSNLAGGELAAVNSNLPGKACRREQ